MIIEEEREMRDSSLEEKKNLIKKANALALRLRTVEPERFLDAPMTEEVSALGKDVKDIYLLRENFTSKDTVRSLEKLILMIYERSYFPVEIPDPHMFVEAVEEFRREVEAEMVSWSRLVEKGGTVREGREEGGRSKE
jgi:hypothetical protein